VSRFPDLLRLTGPLGDVVEPIECPPHVGELFIRETLEVPSVPILEVDGDKRADVLDPPDESEP
jgi:hypothetical protein